MIDYVSAIKYQCKDSLFLGHCKPYSCRLNDSGWETYHLDGCEKMEVQYKPDVGLKIQGSLPYFLNGHNFTFSNEEFVQAIELINSLLGNVGLWESVVTTFEYGVIMPVEQKPKEYILNHFATPKSKYKQVSNAKYNGKFTYWHKPFSDLKLYDAGANILMKQNLSRRGVLEDAGWNPQGNYLKCEVRHLNPLKTMGYPVQLETLQNQSFISNLKQNLMEQYHLLETSRSVVMPTDKKDFFSLDAVLITLIEMTGMPVEQVKKMIYKTINQAECLNISDKKKRKEQINDKIKKIVVSPESRYDLTNRIQEALDNET